MRPSSLHVAPLLIISLLTALEAHGAPLRWDWDEARTASAASVAVADGVSGQSLGLQWAPGEGGQVASVPGLSFSAIGRLGALSLLTVRVSNTGQAQRRLSFVVTQSTPTPGPGVRYWDGGVNDAAAVAGEEPDRRQGADAARFVPLAALSEGDAGLLVGLTPHTNCSYWRPALDYSPQKASRLTQTIRLVLQPGQTDGFTLCAGRFSGAHYGLMQAAWEAYQRAFSANFRPTPGVCDNLWGAAAEYMTWLTARKIHTKGRRWQRACAR